MSNIKVNNAKNIEDSESILSSIDTRLSDKIWSDNVVFSGLILSSTNNTITTSGYSLPVDYFNDLYIICEAGFSIDIRKITDNTTSVFTVTPVWSTNPGAGARFWIINDDGDILYSLGEIHDLAGYINTELAAQGVVQDNQYTEQQAQGVVQDAQYIEQQIITKNQEDYYLWADLAISDNSGEYTASSNTNSTGLVHEAGNEEYSIKAITRTAPTQIIEIATLLQSLKREFLIQTAFEIVENTDTADTGCRYFLIYGRGSDASFQPAFTFNFNTDNASIIDMTFSASNKDFVHEKSFTGITMSYGDKFAMIVYTENNNIIAELHNITADQTSKLTFPIIPTYDSFEDSHQITAIRIYVDNGTTSSQDDLYIKHNVFKSWW